MNNELAAGQRMIFVLMRCALACLMIAIFGGAISVVFYFKDTASFLNSMGIEFQNLRPVHTTFASCWIFLGGITCVFHYLYHAHGEMSLGERQRFRLQMTLWGLAGAGILLTLPFGISSGREYLGFHPVFSMLIVLGWLAFARTYFGRVRRGFWSQPVYVYMWATGIVFFLYTFIEGHAYLIPSIRNNPIADLQIQWKHCGTVVASFNMLVYGSLMYVGEQLSGDKTYARSRKGFAFMGVGLLNSFTNYAHHTYHLPQADLIKWIAFIVSMLEIVILASIFLDLKRSIKAKTPTDRFFAPTGFMSIARYWSFGLLVVALLISVPPLNSFIHGTHVVMAHAMGSEIGIDSFIIFAVFTYILSSVFERCWATQKILESPEFRSLVRGAHWTLVALFSWLVVSGLAVAGTRAFGKPAPDLIARMGPTMLVTIAVIHAYYLTRIFLTLWPLTKAPGLRREQELDILPKAHYEGIASKSDSQA